MKARLRFTRNVLLKGLALFALVNLAFAALQPLPLLGRISAYNLLFPGRLRLPYGEDATRSYNLSLDNLEAMFAAHELNAGEKPADEFRVLVIGDSATWGYLQQPEDTLAAQITAAGEVLPDGRRVVAYNLGYPVMSLTKDLLILSRALRYQPDLIVWPFTLESFPRDKQLFPPLLQHNPEAVRSLLKQSDLPLEDSQLPQETAWQETLLGRRRQLADLLRLQLIGVLWAATGIDHDIPESFTERQVDLSGEVEFHGLQPPELGETDLAMETLAAGVEMAGETPVLLVNEPMFVSQGENSDIRYNFYYPRWAYDDYRRLLADKANENNWHYLDAWDHIPPGEFTNTAVHMTPEGTRQFAQQLLQEIRNLVED